MLESTSKETKLSVGGNKLGIVETGQFNLTFSSI